MNTAFASSVNLMLLTLEAQQAAHLRLCRLGLGGAVAIDEAQLMVREKVEAFSEAVNSMISGGSFDSVVGRYRALVQANIQRLAQDDR